MICCDGAKNLGALEKVFIGAICIRRFENFVVEGAFNKLHSYHRAVGSHHVAVQGSDLIPGHVCKLQVKRHIRVQGLLAVEGPAGRVTKLFCWLWPSPAR